MWSLAFVSPSKSSVRPAIGTIAPLDGLESLGLTWGLASGDVGAALVSCCFCAKINPFFGDNTHSSLIMIGLPSPLPLPLPLPHLPPSPPSAEGRAIGVAE